MPRLSYVQIMPTHHCLAEAPPAVLKRLAHINAKCNVGDVQSFCIISVFLLRLFFELQAIQQGVISTSLKNGKTAENRMF